MHSSAKSAPLSAPVNCTKGRGGAPFSSAELREAAVRCGAARLRYDGAIVWDILSPDYGRLIAWEYLAACRREAAALGGVQ